MSEDGEDGSVAWRRQSSAQCPSLYRSRLRHAALWCLRECGAAHRLLSNIMLARALVCPLFLTIISTRSPCRQVSSATDSLHKAMASPFPLLSRQWRVTLSCAHVLVTQLTFPPLILATVPFHYGRSINIDT